MLIRLKISWNCTGLGQGSVGEGSSSRQLESFTQALAQLADDSSGYVRAAVALNSCATSEILEMLAADEMVDYDCTLQKNRHLVKEAAAKSPHINSLTLALLARDPEEHVRAAAASNLLLSVESMGKMVKDVFWEVRNNIANKFLHPGGSAHLSLCRQDHGCAGHCT